MDCFNIKSVEHGDRAARLKKNEKGMPGFDSISPQFETNGVLPYLWNTLIICVINLTLLSYALEKIYFVRLVEKT